MVRRGLSTVAVLAFLLSWASGNVRADLDLLGNLNATGYNTNGGVSTGQGTNYAVEFTATASDTVNSVQVVLTVQAGVLPTVGIYNATGGAIGSLVGSFTDSSLTPGTAVTETFTGSATLTSGSNYFLVLDSTNDGYYQPGSYTWSATYSSTNLKGLTPTSPGSDATYVAAGGSGSYSASNVMPSFQLNGGVEPFTPVRAPEPSSMVLAALGGGLLLTGGWLQSRRNGNRSAA